MVTAQTAAQICIVYVPIKYFSNYTTSFVPSLVLLLTQELFAGLANSFIVIPLHKIKFRW